MKKLARKKSKRISTRQRVKTEKKVREYNRKVRKDKKKHPEKFQNRSKKDPGVPNECPFKEKIMQVAHLLKGNKLPPVLYTNFKFQLSMLTKHFTKML